MKGREGEKMEKLKFFSSSSRGRSICFGGRVQKTWQPAARHDIEKRIYVYMYTYIHMKEYSERLSGEKERKKIEEEISQIPANSRLVLQQNVEEDRPSAMYIFSKQVGMVG